MTPRQRLQHAAAIARTAGNEGDAERLQEIAALPASDQHLAEQLDAEGTLGGDLVRKYEKLWAARRKVRRVEIPELDARLIDQFLESTQVTTARSNSHGPLDMAKLVAMLLKDVALMVRRPGSWEGHNMAQVMSSHGYEP